MLHFEEIGRPSFEKLRRQLDGESPEVLDPRCEMMPSWLSSGDDDDDDDTVTVRPLTSDASQGHAAQARVRVGGKVRREKRLPQRLAAAAHPVLRTGSQPSSASTLQTPRDRAPQTRRQMSRPPALSSLGQLVRVAAGVLGPRRRRSSPWETGPRQPPRARPHRAYLPQGSHLCW